MADKAIFLDRDDTLIEDVGYINHPDQVKLLDGVCEALIQIRAMGYKLIVVSNQSGVARGIFTEKVLGEIHSRLEELLRRRGVHLDKIYYCPYHPEGAVAKYRKESNWRKPNPGMLLAARDEMNIDLGQSWVIGNSTRDIEAGHSAGCKAILLDNPRHSKDPQIANPRADYNAVNMKEAVNIIKKYNRSESEVGVQIQSGLKSQSQPLQQDVERPRDQESTEQEISAGKSEQLLRSILEQLKGMRRESMFGEFSMMRLIAGVVQVVVLLCLLISVWFLMSPNRQDNLVLIALGFAMVLQLMSLTFYMMQGRK